jgi:hypothetical protein
MSQANAAARKRRAGGATLQENSVPVQAQAQAQVPQNPAGLTLPQVISLVDKRLVTLETFMKESKTATPVSSSSSLSEETMNGMADEFNSKFELLAGEVAELKDIVMKLQSYTMEVNKTLFEERIQVLSDMDNEPMVGDQAMGGDQPIAPEQMIFKMTESN